MVPGTRLGPYEIVAPIGAGGMGEVFRARDTRLDRSVAIKILPTHLSSNPQLRERFDREARAISSLSHPHICALYDVGHQDGTDYIVMEYLEGESLADRLARGPLPIEQVIRYGAQIAEALERAHKAGIVHRDLKPGNVMITRSGAKLLDFGLARRAQGAAISPDDPTKAAHAGQTERKPLTEEGTILGTFQYMAPEQVEGREADPRTDIFALGTLLYEMATGKRAFEGKSRASLIASILDREPPPISTIQPLTPPAFERVVRTCMAKEPDERWQSAHDVAAELKWIGEAEAVQSPQRVRRKAAWLAAGAVLGGAAAAIATFFLARDDASAPAPVARFAITQPAAQPFSYNPNKLLAVSADGNRLVFRALHQGRPHLFLRDLRDMTSRLIAGTENAGGVTFAPDGRSVAFTLTTDGKIRRVSLDGGGPITLFSGSGGVGMIGLDWYGGDVYFPRSFSGGIHAVSASGGEARLVLPADAARGMRAVVWPQVLPGGKALIATSWNNESWDEANIIIHSLDSKTTRVLIDGGSCARYVASGHIVFGRANSLFAVPFDVRELRVTGPPVALVQGVMNGTTNGDYQYAVSDSGSLFYIPGGRRQNDAQLFWTDSSGKLEPAVTTPRPYAVPEISPDGRTVAVVLETATFDVWLLDLERDVATRLSLGGDDTEPIWTPDGRRVIWTSSRSGANNLYWAAVDGSAGEERLTASPNSQEPGSVSPDGKLLFFTDYTKGTGGDIFLLPLAPRQPPRPFLRTKFNERRPAISPDGRWLVYTSNESGADEIYLRPFPGPGGKWQVSTGGGDGAGWTGDGRQILYLHRNTVYAADVQLSPQVRIAKPRLFVQGDDNDGGWDLASDGRLLRVRFVQPAPITQMNVVINWFAELRARVREAR